MKLSRLKINPNNPQIFDDLSKLKESVKDFPKMLKYRPLVADRDGTMQGGNKRLICLQELGFKEIPNEWVMFIDDMTPEEIKRFVIADNVGFGSWDWEKLETDYCIEDLTDWGIEIDTTPNQEIQEEENENIELTKEALDSIELDEKELEVYEKTHILLSLPPDKLIKIQEYIDKISENEFVEIETSSN